MVSVYATNLNDNSFGYIKGVNIHQNFNEYSNYVLIYQDFMRDFADIIEIKSTLTREFMNDDLFPETPSAWGRYVDGYIPVQAQNSKAPQIRSTKAFQIKQNAALNKQQQLNRQNTGF